MSEEEKKEKPKLELLQAGPLYTVELCDPVKEQLTKIEVCKPNIVFKPCNPLEKLKCIPDVYCEPVILPCLPTIVCLPIFGICVPKWVCPPHIVYPPVCGPWIEPIPIERMGELATRVDKLTAEVEAIKKRIGPR